MAPPAKETKVLKQSSLVSFFSKSDATPKKGATKSTASAASDSKNTAPKKGASDPTAAATATSAASDSKNSVNSNSNSNSNKLDVPGRSASLPAPEEDLDSCCSDFHDDASDSYSGCYSDSDSDGEWSSAEPNMIYIAIESFSIPTNQHENNDDSNHNINHDDDAADDDDDDDNDNDNDNDHDGNHESDDDDDDDDDDDIVFLVHPIHHDMMMRSTNPSIPHDISTRIDPSFQNKCGTDSANHKINHNSTNNRNSNHNNVDTDTDVDDNAVDDNANKSPQDLLLSLAKRRSNDGDDESNGHQVPPTPATKHKKQSNPIATSKDDDEEEDFDSDSAFDSSDDEAASDVDRGCSNNPGSLSAEQDKQCINSLKRSNKHVAIGTLSSKNNNAYFSLTDQRSKKMKKAYKASGKETKQA